MAIQSFKELVVWQKAHILALEAHRMARKFPRFELFGLSSQVQRCAVSVPSNIVEGFKREFPRDSRRFYNIAEGSLEELKYQILFARDAGYINAADCDRIENMAEEVGRLLAGWKKSQEKQ
jgi:four helix bundle protein